VDPGGQVIVVAELTEKERDHAEVLGRHVGPVVKEGLGHDAAEIEDHAVELARGGNRLRGCLLFSHLLHCA
jgi:hypothetical protein